MFIFIEIVVLSAVSTALVTFLVIEINSLLIGFGLSNSFAGFLSILLTSLVVSLVALYVTKDN